MADPVRRACGKVQILHVGREIVRREDGWSNSIQDQLDWVVSICVLAHSSLVVPDRLTYMYDAGGNAVCCVLCVFR